MILLGDLFSLKNIPVILLHDRLHKSPFLLPLMSPCLQHSTVRSPELTPSDKSSKTSSGCFIE